ncbi:MAG: protein translocase subunit SecDF [Flavobacteriales bacterium]|nr:protein translocase subunit SecDF [Flavobacteriales bacterium]
MQNKGAIKLFAILLALVCLYQLSFTIVTRVAEKEFAELKETDPQAADKYIEDFRYNFLYLKEYTYMDCKELELNLGLDLKGGMNVTLEISLQEMLRALANNSPDTTFNKAIDNATAQMANSTENFVTLFGQEFEKLDPNARLASPAIYGYTLKDKITGDATNAQVLDILREEKEAAIEQAFQVLRTRIDKFGVTQPNIQRLEGSDRIQVELPGVNDPERVRKLLQGTAKLEFWETYDNNEVYGILAEANALLRDIEKGTTTTEVDTAKVETVKEEKAEGEKSLVDKLATDTNTVDSDVALDEMRKENPLFAVLQPAASQEGLFSGPVVGYASVRDTAKVNAYLNNERVRSIIPRDLKLLWTIKPINDEATQVHQLVAIKVTSRDGLPPLSGDGIADANKDFGQFGASPEVSMLMTPEGANVWKKLTGENVGKSIAIVLDDYVYSFPTVQGEIAGGRSSITGNFTIKEAEDLATVLKAGKLPAPARIVEEAVVGPTLGQESINAGAASFIAAIILVMVFMVVYYNLAGWAANLALMANVFFIFGVLASIGAVLTLPGIAGIVLTIGISIDSNVLIFERVREELAKGTGMRLAVKQGYDAAYSAIIDSNVTSLLTGIILYVFGTGPIQGFATTLIIGIFCSLFASIFLTRLVFESRLDAKKAITVATKLSEGAFKKVNFDFIGKRKVAYVISGLLIVAGLISFGVRGFNYGVDFLGGRSYVVEFTEPVDGAELSKSLADAFETAPLVKTFGSDNRVKIITAYRIADNGVSVDDEVLERLEAGLAASGKSGEVLSSQKVGPTIANDIKRSAMLAVIFSLIVIFAYILLRFKKWQFGAGAVVALFHDVLLVLSMFSLFYGIMPFSMEIDQAFIAAILTVVGYSINDTVVVFDRIREFQAEHLASSSRHSLKDVLNSAINSTLSRTVMTGVTTLLVLLVLFLFGGESIKGFTFALLAGLVIGTYSSVFIATPVMMEFVKKPVKEEKKKK